MQEIQTDLKAFRSEVRAWLEENCPESMRQPMQVESDYCWGGRQGTFKNEDQKLWFERMRDQGWTAPQWPKAYGGGGLSKVENKILQEEMIHLGCRLPLHSFGIWMLGPALLMYGNESQKLEHLTKITQGEIRWCQGYSEPGAGSDLASLQTRAEDHGDYYLVNGSKIWTSYADKADWIFCLVRTDPEAKHRGISFLLIDMDSEGVSTQPIKLISGKSPFCQTYFDQVKVPKANLVGEENAGWTIAKYLLQHERDMIGSSFNSAAEKPLHEVAIDTVGLENAKLADETLRMEVAQLEMDWMAHELNVTRGLDEAKQGAGMGAKSSMYKYIGTELNKQKHEIIISLHGHEALGWEGEAFQEGDIPRKWLRTKANSIEGGTSEIQLNIISKHILGLPS